MLIVEIDDEQDGKAQPSLRAALCVLGFDTKHVAIDIYQRAAAVSRMSVRPSGLHPGSLRIRWRATELTTTL